MRGNRPVGRVSARPAPEAVKPRRSLDEYAEEHPWRGGGRGCWVCALPPDIRAAIDKGKRDGTRNVRQMVGWLVDVCEMPAELATPARLEGHFQRRHHQ